MHRVLIYDYTIRNFDTGLPTGEVHRVVCSCGVVSPQYPSLTTAIEQAFDHLDIMALAS